MTHLIHIQADSKHSKYEALLTQVASVTLKTVDAQPGELSIVLTDESKIRDLNRTYGDSDQPTDVLSFKNGSMDPDSGMLYFGDVIIAVPVAEIQATSAGHSLEAELELLTAHGVLHLLGYDHSSLEEKNEMWAVQSRILHSLGVQLNKPR